MGLVLVAILLSCSRPDLYAKRDVPGVIYWHGDLAAPKIALTFDDGPNEPYTSQILQILAANDVHATFFLVGKRVEEFPASARAIVAAGHAIGNHSYTHPHMTTEDEPRVVGEVGRAEAAILAATGTRPRIFRAPFGEVDPLMFREAEQLGYVTIQWSVAARDWVRPGIVKIVRRILAGTHRGAIILLHDGDGLLGGDRSETVEAVKIIVPELRKRGFVFVTVPELLGIDAR